jgi:hypothetical protein
MVSKKIEENSAKFKFVVLMLTMSRINTPSTAQSKASQLAGDHEFHAWLLSTLFTCKIGCFRLQTMDVQCIPEREHESPQQPYRVPSVFS